MANQAAPQPERVTQDCSAVLNQLAAYFANVLDERSFADLLVNMAHLRIRLHEVDTPPAHCRAALSAARSGVLRAVEVLRSV